MNKIRIATVALGLAAAAAAQTRIADAGAIARANARIAQSANDMGLSDNGSALRLRGSRADGLRSHVRYDQFYRNVKVFEGEAIAHVTANAVTLTDAVQRVGALNVVPRLNQAAGVASAVASLRLRGQATVESSELQVLARGARSTVDRLVWHVIVIAENGVDEPGRWDVFVDAQSGGVVWSFESLHTAAAVGVGRTMYVGNVSLDTDFTGSTYNLVDRLRSNNETRDLRGFPGGSGVIATDVANDFGNNARDTSDADTAAADAHYGLMKTWDYYKLVHGRNGIDGLGRKTYNRVHYSVNYQNAFWSNSCFCMTFGDGGSTFTPLVSIDVAGHEMTHGVTSKEANLTYSGESGGLNEATSDIFGTLVEFYANSAADTPDWWIGERIYRSNWATGSFVQDKALRYMDDPAKDTKSPACWSSTLGTLNVHYSSGPANHMFYLLANGGTSKCNGNTVAGIGRDKAGSIWYKALADYMTSSSNYAAAKTAALNAATALYGAASAERAAVISAFTAINVP